MTPRPKPPGWCSPSASPPGTAPLIATVTTTPCPSIDVQGLRPENRRMPAMGEAAAHASTITVNDVFQRAFRVFGDRPAVTSQNVRLTYAQLGERSRRLAGALYSMGFRRGDRLAVLSETRPEYVEVYAAAASLGVTVVALNLRLHPDEVRYCVDIAKPTLLFSTAML